MKPDDKFPEEMLEDIREQADSATDELCDLAYAISNFRDKCPTHPAFAEMRWWWAVAVTAMDNIGDVADRAKKLADIKGEKENK